MLRHRVARELARLIGPTARVLVATSGGPDSQTLLHALAHGHRVVAAGIDHGLRAEAARELELAEALADQLGVPFVRRTVTVASGNVMHEARKARYAALHAIAREHGARFIAVAHTASDQLEQTLIELVRNNGAHGIKGIPEKRGIIVRPLLTTTRDEVLAYLTEHAIPFATDPSNADRQRTRARLRHDVVPVLKALNPSVERTITPWLRERSRDEALLDRRARKLVEHARNRRSTPSFVPVVEHIEAAPILPDAPRALAVWLRDVLQLTPRRRLLERLGRGILRARSSVRSREGTFSFDGTTLWFIPASSTTYSASLEVPGEVRVARARITAAAGDPPQNLHVVDAVAFDADDLQIPLVVRAWRRGDRLVPFQRGSEGHSVKVSDLFINAKIPRALRSSWPVVVHGERIIWVVGLRRSNAAPITASTRRAVTLAVSA